MKPVGPRAAQTLRHRAREAKEWRIVGLVCVGVLALLAVLSYQGGRAAADGPLAGIGWRYLQGVVLTMAIFALFALGLSLEFGFTGLINFGHVLFLGIGAYTASILAWKWGPWTDVGLATALGVSVLIIAVASLAAIAAALLLGIPTLRLREDYLAIITIGAAEILRTAALNEAHLTNGPNGLSVRMPGAAWVLSPASWWNGMFQALREGPLHVNLDPYFAFLTMLVAGALGFWFWVVHVLSASPWGRIVRAIREDEDVAASLGKNVFAVKLQSLAIGSVVAAMAGILYAWFQRFVTPESFLPIVTFYAWIILVVGGTGNHKGVLAGSVVLWGLFEAARQLSFLDAIGVGTPSGPQQVVFIGLLLVLIMLFRPQGALGRKEELVHA